ncbi:MAG TPA: hypothetical protein VMV72_13665 [Verrucomicrobiae bacterium]|nr:hypothetical protein [Verrucomicrobiae bacterium]
MRDLTNPVAIKIKGALFLVAGVVSAGLLWWERPTLRTAALLVITVWCFCRCYYFAFYVIERYVDPGYRFSGMGSFVRYVMRRRKAGR